MFSNRPLTSVPTVVQRSFRRNARRVILESCILGRRQSAERCPPDFVIVGAQRCGTTSLFRALNKHPALMANALNAKGVHYFDTSYHKNEQWYFAHFPSREERERYSEKHGVNAIAGEASPYYLFHPAVAERMAQSIANTKIIVLLRDPVKRAISHYLHMVWEGHESVMNIDHAFDMESERLAGVEERLRKDTSFVSRPHQHHSYLARGHYAQQLERLYRYFDKSNVLVMSTEKLIADSQQSLSAIQSFIGLEPDPCVHLEKRNASTKFDPNPHTVNRLIDEYADSNSRLKSLVDIEIPWL